VYNNFWSKKKNNIGQCTIGEKLFRREHNRNIAQGVKPKPRDQAVQGFKLSPSYQPLVLVYGS
jgi:hypothetical protein